MIWQCPRTCLGADKSVCNEKRARPTGGAGALTPAVSSLLPTLTPTRGGGLIGGIRRRLGGLLGSLFGGRGGAGGGATRVDNIE